MLKILYQVAVCLLAMPSMALVPACTNHGGPAPSVQPALGDGSVPQISKQVRGFLIANFTVTDEVTFNQYRSDVQKFFKNFEGRMIMRDTHSSTLQGSSSEKVLAIIEFPDPEAARRYYFSPEYTAAKRNRIAASTGEVALTAGAPGPPSLPTAQPRGFLVASFPRQNVAEADAHLASVSELLQRHGARILIFDKRTEPVEGPDRVIAVFEFPDVSLAAKFFHSREYAALRRAQLSSVDAKIVLGSGIPG